MLPMMDDKRGSPDDGNNVNLCIQMCMVSIDMVVYVALGTGKGTGCRINDKPGATLHLLRYP